MKNKNYILSWLTLFLQPLAVSGSDHTVNAQTYKAAWNIWEAINARGHLDYTWWRIWESCYEEPFKGWGREMTGLEWCIRQSKGCKEFTWIRWRQTDYLMSWSIRKMRINDLCKSGCGRVKLRLEKEPIVNPSFLVWVPLWMVELLMKLWYTQTVDKHDATKGEGRYNHRTMSMKQEWSERKRNKCQKEPIVA